MSPLEETLLRLGTAADRLSFVAWPRHRAVPAPRLIRQRAELAGAVEAFGRSVGTRDGAVAASLFGQAWTVSATRAAIACLSGERRVPDVAAANSVLLIDATGRPAGVMLKAPRFVAVAGDRAASDPSAEVVPDTDALFAWTRRQLFDRHLGPLVDALHDLVPVGRRLLWGNVAAACAGGFAALSGTAIDPERLMADAAALLDSDDAPTCGLAQLFPVEHAGGTRLFVRRETCCLFYRLPDAPPWCLSCRLLSEPERLRRITLRLEAATA